MFKNRTFLQGLGIGLIVGAVLLQLMFSVSQTEQKLDTNLSANLKLSRKELAVSADQLGYKLVSNEEKMYTEKQVQEAVKKAREQNQRSQTKNGSGSVQQDARQPSYAFVIPQGSGSSEVASLLLDLGIIQDQNTFQNELDKRRLSDKIQAGTYKFIGSPQIDDLIRKITSQPK